MPWAEDQFLERVSGQPLNPPPSEAWWPYAQAGNAAHKTDEKFSHTYPERFWPKRAGAGPDMRFTDWQEGECDAYGIRYPYGDLNDVVAQLEKDRTTRQAYLPVFFPEDTGAVEGQRVPCTLGYHFLWRRQLNVTYFIRSCDFVRHFTDDAYMAARLGQWVAEKVGADTGALTMHIVSLHIFEADRTRMLHGQ